MRVALLSLLFAPSLALLVVLLGGCTSVPTQEIDRSLVSSPLMSFTKGAADLVAPHTGLRGAAASSSGGCSVCAH